MRLLTFFGTFTVAIMLISYALEKRFADWIASYTEGSTGAKDLVLDIFWYQSSSNAPIAEANDFCYYSNVEVDEAIW